LIVPQRIAHDRAHLNAVKQFLAHGIHHTERKTGILIFISLQEQYGEIIVDRLIEEKIGREFFLQKVEQMLEECRRGNIGKAFQMTIAEIGERLALEFPKSENDKNELADKLIVM
jgi:putative membrane protein